jgi:FkbM family methyltransferase
VSEGILAGATYPQLPIDVDVATVVDVGANCGAASVYFARCYPDATVHAIEPASAAFALLERNTSSLPNVRRHRVGLHRADEVVPLYHGALDAVTASILPRADKNTAESEMVQIRDARAWTAENGITSIDVLKLDSEGCEVEILERLGDLLPTIQIAYIEYDSTGARRAIDRILEPTHELCQGLMFLDQGEMIYVARRLLDPDRQAVLVDFFRQRITATHLGGASTH